MEIEKDKEFKWSKPLRGYPEKRGQGRYCRYHKNVGHDTDDYRQLKDEIKYLIRRGKFERFTKAPGASTQYDLKRSYSSWTTRNPQKSNVRDVMSTVGEPSKCSKSEMTLEFGDPDLEDLKFPHDDPLVITPVIGNCPIMRVLVDNEASVDILFHDTFIRMGYNDSQLTSSDAPIYGFNHVECEVEGAI
ncbi:uncharacterized protein LOC141685393 [Apium graveolens]|uniref:uncharacterized protein LOC141685393 n=1 Tax=Apium graveolens TaxID=4045 RepID=UPI003D79FDE4